MKRYVEETSGHARELSNLLGSEGIDAIRRQLSGRTRSDVEVMIKSKCGIAFVLLGSPPARRAQLLRSHGETRELLLYVSVVWAQRAARMLDAIDLYALSPGAPYRKMTRQAAEAASDFLESADDLWPFRGSKPYSG